ncbi:MAG: L,D-transpeptidase family protein [Sphingomonadales bacterium]|nr:L,D-transpeptidase family protein [Sphingomonadales bacterium]
MPAGRPPLALAAGCAVAAALVIGVSALRAGYAAPLPSKTVIDASSVAGARLYYPPSRLPTVTLPDGRTATIQSVLNIKVPLRYGQSVWNEENVPQGPVWVRIDLTRQLLSVFRAGHEIGTAVVLYGAADKESPVGTFPVLEKARVYHSQTYDAPMPFMLRLTADGVAIHGSDVRRGAATHGCIGVPTVFARQLFAAVRLGDPVVIVKPAPAS